MCLSDYVRLCQKDKWFGHLGSKLILGSVRIYEQCASAVVSFKFACCCGCCVIFPRSQFSDVFVLLVIQNRIQLMKSVFYSNIYRCKTRPATNGPVHVQQNAARRLGQEEKPDKPKDQVNQRLNELTFFTIGCYTLSYVAWLGWHVHQVCFGKKWAVYGMIKRRSHLRLFGELAIRCLEQEAKPDKVEDEVHHSQCGYDVGASAGQETGRRQWPKKYCQKEKSWPWKWKRTKKTRKKTTSQTENLKRKRKKRPKKAGSQGRSEGVREWEREDGK